MMEMMKFLIEGVSLVQPFIYSFRLFIEFKMTSREENPKTIELKLIRI